jgi:hypothetical protein
MPVLTAKRAYLSAIREGRKTTTIRATCRVRPGDVVTFTNFQVSLRTYCTGVTATRFGDLTEADAHADGFASLADLQDALRAHYPLTASSPLWIIRFALNDSAQHALAFP